MPAKKNFIAHIAPTRLSRRKLSFLCGKGGRNLVLIVRQPNIWVRGLAVAMISDELPTYHLLDLDRKIEFGWMAGPAAWKEAINFILKLDAEHRNQE